MGGILKAFSGKGEENLQSGLDREQSNLLLLRGKKDALEGELGILAKYKDLYDDYRKQFLGQRLEYLRCLVESTPYSDELQHRHIDGQIAEVKWQMRAREDILNELKRTEAEIGRARDQIGKLHQQIAGKE